MAALGDKNLDELLEILHRYSSADAFVGGRGNLINLTYFWVVILNLRFCVNKSWEVTHTVQEKEN